MSPEDCIAQIERYGPPQSAAAQATAAHLRRLGALERLLMQNVEVEANPLHTGYDAFHYGDERDTWAGGETPLAALLALREALGARGGGVTPQPKPCPSCGGDGWWAHPQDVCRICGGTGTATVPADEGGERGE